MPAGSVNTGVNAYLGTLSKAKTLAVHKASVPPRTIFTGGRFSLTAISVSADCVQTNSPRTDAVSASAVVSRYGLPLPLMFVISTPCLNTCILLCVKHSI